MFKKLLDNVNPKILMKRKKPPVNQDVLDKYEEVAKKKNYIISQQADRKTGAYYYNEYVRQEFKAINNKEDYIADILIYYLYVEHETRSKDILWDAYGHIIVENIKHNLSGTVVCEDCLKRFKTKQDNEILCTSCKSIRKKEQDKIANEKRRNARKAQPTER